MSDIILSGILAIVAGVLSLIVGGINVAHADPEYGITIDGDCSFGWFDYIIYILAHILIFAFLCLMLFEDNIVASGNAMMLLVCVIVCGIFFFLPLFIRYNVAHFILHLALGITFGVCAYLTQADIVLSVVMGFCAVIAIFSGSFIHKLVHWIIGVIVVLGGVYNIIGVIAVLIFSLFT